jgi:hypothetical protein
LVPAWQVALHLGDGTAYFTSPEFLALTGGLPDAEVMLLGRAYHLEEAKVGTLNRIVETSGANLVTWGVNSPSSLRSTAQGSASKVAAPTLPQREVSITAARPQPSFLSSVVPGVFIVSEYSSRISFAGPHAA